MEGFLLNRNQTHWKIILSSLEVELCSAQSLFIAAVVIVGLGSDPLYYDLLLRCARRQQGRSKTTDLMVRKIAQDERSKPLYFFSRPLGKQRRETKKNYRLRREFATAY